jgi:hypothetical protein
MDNLKPGDKLPNGTTLMILGRLPDRVGNLPGAIVMAYDDKGKQFATWMYVDDPKGAYCTTGWYRKDVEDALRDYHFRLRRLEKFSA